jgi:hypothetical protein
MGRFADFFREQHITLAGQQKQKMLSLDSEFEQMKAERETLKTENLHLKAQVNPLQRQVDQLRGQIQRAEEKSAADKNQALDDNSVKLLRAIANRFHVSEKGGASIIGGTDAQAEFHLGILRRRRFIKFAGANYTVDGRYVATQEGLEYLHKIGKL